MIPQPATYAPWVCAWSFLSDDDPKGGHEGTKNTNVFVKNVLGFFRVFVLSWRFFS
jgi:hypothetical protein